MSYRETICAHALPLLPGASPLYSAAPISSVNHDDVIKNLIEVADMDAATSKRIEEQTIKLIETVRQQTSPSMMEAFLAEYGLSTQEGVALMTLAEALLRTPDTPTIDELIDDKLSVGAWERHIGQSKSALVNSATWGLLLTGKVLTHNQEKSVLSAMRQMVRRVGEPVIRNAVATAMKRLGKQFVLGTSIENALMEGAAEARKGYQFSFDMLGEAARTQADALRYFDAYAEAIQHLAPYCTEQSISENPGISVKLSALHARYEAVQQDRVMTELYPRAEALALQAAKASMGFNIDAEEQDRLDISLDIIEKLMANEELRTFEGLGIVVQAYGPRALHVIDFLHDLAKRYDSKIMIRLVKGAYWDTEIKRAQTLGLKGFPVFTRKVHTDASYIACAKRLHHYRDRIYPQFATHNAHTVSAVLDLFGDDKSSYEFQRLHGMGEALHDIVKSEHKTRCRIYAPVGNHKDLLAYLVRRLLENGANSSFVNQIVDHTKSAADIAQCPIDYLRDSANHAPNNNLTKPTDLFEPQRKNSVGFDWTDPLERKMLEVGIKAFAHTEWVALPTGIALDNSRLNTVRNPAKESDAVGKVQHATTREAEEAIKKALSAQPSWSAIEQQKRSTILHKIADLYEENWAELFAILIREAGKPIPDAIAELREAVDFLRFYAEEAKAHTGMRARGVFTCISPWNFPLAIFTGQIAAALVTGNAIMAKPAEQTPLIASKAVALMHAAGVPQDILALLPGDGAIVGAALTANPAIAGVCFTGSTETAQRIHRTLAEKGNAQAPLIAETGGLNAMIVDSSALPEQAVRDIVASAFQSAGQRCSALRMLYVQEDTADHLIEMLEGAMNELAITDPAQLCCDVGPVIDRQAQEKLNSYTKQLEARGQVLKKLEAPNTGTYVAPHLIRVDGIEALGQEMFGPILHVATFKAREFDKIIDRINAKGFGLTFGLHTRIEQRVDRAVSKAHVGNIYINRNQIGAIVGSQPFGGEGLSGTGPKAGGPLYLSRFLKSKSENLPATKTQEVDNVIPAIEVNKALKELAKVSVQAQSGADGLLTLAKDNCDATHALECALQLANTQRTLPGPTGESNRWSVHARGSFVITGTDKAQLLKQLIQALALGNKALVIAPFALELAAPYEDAGWPVRALDGLIDPDDLEFLEPLDGVASAAVIATQQAMRLALAKRGGAILPLITESIAVERFVHERHLCIDTTAAGGNATLLAATDS